ncbi:MAG: hypothetical protein HYT78_06625 [Deltaproteobacteria bacterium]|nr:hypothetical protein [Deltaproteobacteria bacterium]
MAAVGNFVLGGIAGVISLLFFPRLFIKPRWARWLNLILSPIAAGGAMSLIGAHRRKKGQSVIRLDSFAYGFLFALSMAMVRFVWGQ